MQARRSRCRCRKRQHCGIPASHRMLPSSSRCMTGAAGGLGQPQAARWAWRCTRGSTSTCSSARHHRAAETLSVLPVFSASARIQIMVSAQAAARCRWQPGPASPPRPVDTRARWCAGCQVHPPARSVRRQSATSSCRLTAQLVRALPSAASVGGLGG
jgi:hypothetical protein